MKLKGTQIELLDTPKKKKPKRKGRPLNISGIDENLRNSLTLAAIQCGYGENISALVRGIARGEVKLSTSNNPEVDARLALMDEKIHMLESANRKLWKLAESLSEEQKTGE